MYTVISNLRDMKVNEDIIDKYKVFIENMYHEFLIKTIIKYAIYVIYLFVFVYLGIQNILFINDNSWIHLMWIPILIKVSNLESFKISDELSDLSVEIFTLIKNSEENVDITA